MQTKRNWVRTGKGYRMEFEGFDYAASVVKQEHIKATKRANLFKARDMMKRIAKRLDEQWNNTTFNDYTESAKFCLIQRHEGEIYPSHEIDACFNDCLDLIEDELEALENEMFSCGYISHKPEMRDSRYFGVHSF